MVNAWCDKCHAEPGQRCKNLTTKWRTDKYGNYRRRIKWHPFYTKRPHKGRIQIA
jgi:hypothetical protein